MKSFSNTLHAIGQPLSDSELISYILAGLGYDYDPLILSFTAQFEKKTLQEVYGHRLEQPYTSL